MILIITESAKLSRLISRALNATDEPVPGVYVGANETIVSIDKGFIMPLPIHQTFNNNPFSESLPYVPSGYAFGIRRCADNGRWEVSDNDKAIDRQLQSLFADADEVAFASDGGADAQARFHNICQHYKVGVATSRIRIYDSDYSSIRKAYRKRERGRHLHNIAQSGLVNMAMEELFSYNIEQSLATVYGNGAFPITRLDLIALDFLNVAIRERTSNVESTAKHSVSITVRTCGQTINLCPVELWDNRDECEVNYESINVGENIMASYVESIPVFEPSSELFTLVTLQTEAYDRLHFSFSKTLEITNSLFERGLISSPLTSDSRLPESMRKDMVSLFRGAKDYMFCNMEEQDRHGIVTTGRIPFFLSDEETSLWRLISDRQELAFSAGRYYGELIVGAEVNGVEYFGSCNVGRDFMLQEEPINLRIIGKSILSHTPKPPHPMNFTELLQALDAYLGSAVPYNGIFEAGNVIDRLVANGYVNVFFGEPHLTDKGSLLLLRFKDSPVAANLMAAMAEADALATAKYPDGNGLMHRFEQMICDEVSLLLSDGKLSRQVKTSHICPKCKAGAMSAASRTLRCGHCGHTIPRFVCGLELPEHIISQLVTHGYASPLYGFTGRKGRKFSEALMLDANFRVTFAPSEACIY